jgi:hypothetical protein
MPELGCRAKGKEKPSQRLMRYLKSSVHETRGGVWLLPGLRQ